VRSAAQGGFAGGRARNPSQSERSPENWIASFTEKLTIAGMSSVAVALTMFAALLALLVALRTKTGNKVDIRNSDIVLALVPVALWLFLTGKIQEFGFGEVKIVAAIKMAATAPVGPEVSKLTIEAVSGQCG
jgi:hypothetical protein